MRFHYRPPPPWSSERGILLRAARENGVGSGKRGGLGVGDIFQQLLGPGPVRHQAFVFGHDFGGDDTIADFERWTESTANADAQNALGPCFERASDARAQSCGVAAADHGRNVRPRDQFRFGGRRPVTATIMRIDTLEGCASR